MKRTIIALSVIMALGMAGCSSTKVAGLEPAEDTKVPVKDTRIATDFADQGLRLHYTLTGKLEKIEVHGVAPSWQGNYDIRAEMDAKEKLIKFIYGESMSSDTRTKILTKTLDRARDETLNRIDSNTDLTFNAKEVEKEFEKGDETNAERPNNNTSQRTAQRIENTVLQKTQALTSAGRITGLHKVSERISSNGRFYIAKYEWTEKSQATSELLRSKMR